MIGLLRVIRGFCGFLFGWQILGLIPVLSWVQQPSAITGSMWAVLILKLVAIVIFGSLFFGLRRLINYMHTKKHNLPHPALANNNWAL